MRNIYKQIFKLIFSLFLLAVVLKRTDIPLLVSALRGLSPLCISLVLLFSLSSITLAAKRCQVSIKAKCAAKISLLDSYRYYLIGMFYNNLLPTSIGGDVFRICLLNKGINQPYQVSSAVFIERLAGFFAVLFLSLSGALLLYAMEGPAVYVYYLSGLLFVTGLITILLFNPTFWFFIRNIFQDLALPEWVLAVGKFINILHEYRLQKKLLGKILILSILYQMCDILVAYMFGIVIGFNISFPFFLLFIPLVYIATLIPVSINGLGVRENAIVYLFSTVGAKDHKALLLSLLIYSDRVAKGLIGGIIALIPAKAGRDEGREIECMAQKNG